MMFRPLALLVFLAAAAFAQSETSGRSDPEMVRGVEYTLPEEAKAAGIDGAVHVAVEINERGDVTDARALAGPQWPCAGDTPDRLIESVLRGAEAAARATKFKPAIEKGKPVKVTVTLRIWLSNALAERRKKLEAAGKPQPLIVNAGTVNGRAISLPRPAYPIDATMRGAAGVINVSVVLDENGNVTAAGAQNGDRVLQRAARDAACKARFNPTLLQGKPVTVTGKIVYIFEASPRWP